jgi:predicted SnoaL-like aldol condensation-catalyzing enzyme
MRQTRKQIAMEFLKAAASGEARAAFDAYTSKDFRHHNPHYGAAPKDLAAGMDESAQENPDRLFDIQHALEVEDMVAVHSRVQFHPPEGDAIAVVHLFRFVGDKIVEFWDVGQPVPAGSPNTNGAF